MAKLTKSQRADIERALYHAQRAQRYIMRPDIVVASQCAQATTSLHYTRANCEGGALFPVAKECGSDLCGLADAIKGLEQMLGPQ